MFIPKIISGKRVDLVLVELLDNVNKTQDEPIIYNICLHNENTIIGYCDLRFGYSENNYYYGNIGFSVTEKYRGNGYACEAVNLSKIIFKQNNMNKIIIVNGLDNYASKRVCEKVGARLLKICEVPKYLCDVEDENERLKNVWELKI